jgi:hypothetical protein
MFLLEIKAMNADIFWVALVGVIVGIVLVLFLIRNQKDKKELLEKMNAESFLDEINQNSHLKDDPSDGK